MEREDLLLLASIHPFHSKGEGRRELEKLEKSEKGRKPLWLAQEKTRSRWLRREKRFEEGRRLG